MKTFGWIPREEMQVTTTPSISVVKFGDGYEQRRPTGLNSQLKSFQPVFRVIGAAEAAALEDFLSWHGGYRAFLWRPPTLNRTIKVVCREWSMQASAIYADFSCKFEQVVA